MLSIEAFAHRIERTRADIAVHDSKTGETQDSKAILATLRHCHGRRGASRLRDDGS